MFFDISHNILKLGECKAYIAVCTAVINCNLSAFRVMNGCTGEAYIGNKAASLDCALSVSVTLAAEAPFAPVSVELLGDVSPSAKQELSQWLRDNFGLGGEEQVWRSS